jgi:hypothetical protein
MEWNVRLVQTDGDMFVEDTETGECDKVEREKAERAIGAGWITLVGDKVYVTSYGMISLGKSLEEAIAAEDAICKAVSASFLAGGEDDQK